MPNPQLCRVGYIGQNTDHLIESLRLFSDSLAIISAYRDKAADINNSRIDLFVLQTERIEYLKIVYALLASDGWFYWEINRIEILRSLLGLSKQKFSINVFKNNIKNFWRLNRYPYLIAYLYRLGFRDIELHWHRPNFKQCLEIIPLQNEAALRQVFSRAKGGFIGKCKIVFGRFLVNAGLLAYFAPCFSVVAKKAKQQ